MRGISRAISCRPRRSENLYNGNIGSMDIDIRALATTGSRDLGPMIYNYGYDQLNRISKMDAWAASGKFTPGTGSDSLKDYAERYSYDPNGNILTLNRTGDSVHPAKAKLTYNYIYAKTSGGQWRVYSGSDTDERGGETDQPVVEYPGDGFRRGGESE